MKSTKIVWSPCTLVLLICGFLFGAGCGNKDAELAEQRQKELETVRAELEHVKTSAAMQEAELNRLRKDSVELLRLRNEARQWRDEKKQLSQQVQTAQTQAQQAQAQVQVIQSQSQQAARALATQQQALV
jgi:septal ring factor EnvC (AmiA/AmiB activator)